MNMWDFFDNHWFIAWCALWGIWPVYFLLSTVLFRLPNRAMRFTVILFRGWPPAHLDADGDLRPAAKAQEVKP